MEEVVEVKWITGFWRRIGAFLIDAILLGFVGFLLGLGFESTFVELGSWGRVVGFSIALIYFGCMNSRLFSGQTIGKKILKIKVVNLENESIGLARSFLRYSILAIPSSLNGLYFEENSNIDFLVYPLTFIVF